MLKLVAREILSPYCHSKVRNTSLRFLWPRTGPHTVVTSCAISQKTPFQFDRSYAHTCLSFTPGARFSKAPETFRAGKVIFYLIGILRQLDFSYALSCKKVHPTQTISL